MGSLWNGGLNGMVECIECGSLWSGEVYGVGSIWSVGM